MPSNRGYLLQKKQNRAKPKSNLPLHLYISLPLVINTWKHWKNESMVSALEVIKMELLAVLHGAVMYHNIPKQMLYDRVNGHVTH